MKMEKQRNKRTDPDYRADENRQLREARKADPTYNKRKSALRKNPKHRKKAADRQRVRMEDPAYRDKVNARRRKKSCEDPYFKERRKEQRKNGREKANATALVYQTAKRLQEPHFKMRMSLSNRLNSALKSKGLKKTLTTMELTGSTLSDLRDHLESQFKEGMTWQNYGKTGWHIDHIKPCVLFDLSEIDQQKLCFHFKNLQPLWYWENFEKGKQYQDVQSNMR